MVIVLTLDYHLLLLSVVFVVVLRITGTTLLVILGVVLLVRFLLLLISSTLLMLTGRRLPETMKEHAFVLFTLHVGDVVQHYDLRLFAFLQVLQTEMLALVLHRDIYVDLGHQFVPQLLGAALIEPGKAMVLFSVIGLFFLLALAALRFFPAAVALFFTGVVGRLLPLFVLLGFLFLVLHNCILAECYFQGIRILARFQFLVSLDIRFGRRADKLDLF